MTTDDERPDTIPSPVDPDYECVRVDTQEPSGQVAAPPEPSPVDDELRRLCPEGYVPRRRRRMNYQLDGKRLVSDRPPEENPFTIDDDRRR